MLLRRGFRFLLQPSPLQRHHFACAAGCARLVWNTALALQKQRLADKLPLLSYEDLSALLKLWKKEKPFLKEAPSQPLQQKLIDFRKAIDDARDPSSAKQFPVFKKKGEDDSFRYPQHFVMEQDRSRILLPKLGWVRYVNSQQITGTPKNVTLSLDAGRWYVSIQTEQEIQEHIHPSTSIIGGDLGVAHFLTLSDGTHFDSPDYKPLEKKIKREQRKLSNKRKGSKNYQKQRVKLQRSNKRLRDKREDFQHKLSHNLSKNHAVIVLEKLRVKNMTKSAKGTLAEPGKNVRQKAGLNRSILRQGWGEFRRQLKYKCEWRGGRYREVSPKYTSQCCSECGFVSPENRKTQSQFACISCKHVEHADINAAKNIRALGLLELKKPQEAKPAKKRKKDAVALSAVPRESRGSDVSNEVYGRTAGRAGIACCETVSSSSQKRAKALKASQ